MRTFLPVCIVISVLALGACASNRARNFSVDSSIKVSEDDRKLVLSSAPTLFSPPSDNYGDYGPFVQARFVWVSTVSDAMDIGLAIPYRNGNGSYLAVAQAQLSINGQFYGLTPLDVDPGADPTHPPLIRWYRFSFDEVKMLLTANDAYFRVSDGTGKVLGLISNGGAPSPAAVEMGKMLNGAQEAMPYALKKNAKIQKMIARKPGPAEIPGPSSLQQGVQVDNTNNRTSAADTDHGPVAIKPTSDADSTSTRSAQAEGAGDHPNGVAAEDYGVVAIKPVATAPETDNTPHPARNLDGAGDHSAVSNPADHGMVGAKPLSANPDADSTPHLTSKFDSDGNHSAMSNAGDHGVVAIKPVSAVPEGVNHAAVAGANDQGVVAIKPIPSPDAPPHTGFTSDFPPQIP